MVRQTTNKTDVFHLLHNLTFGYVTDARVIAIGTCNSSRVHLVYGEYRYAQTPKHDASSESPPLYDEGPVSKRFLISPAFITGTSFLYMKLGPDPRLHDGMHPYASWLDDTKTEQWNTGR